MFVLGIVLLLIHHFPLDDPILSIVAIILMVVGAVFEIAAAGGPSVAGRRHRC